VRPDIIEVRRQIPCRNRRPDAPARSAGDGRSAHTPPARRTATPPVGLSRRTLREVPKGGLT
jgi:hypothetical protein